MTREHREVYDLVVIGGGVAGLTAAALAAAEGATVLLVEHHTIAGGCATFYQRGGYRFDVGATLAGGFNSRGIHARIFAKLGISPRAIRLDPAMIVHMPDITYSSFGDARRFAERDRVFGADAVAFFTRQEAIADCAWRIAQQTPPLPRGLRSAVRALRAIGIENLGLSLALGKSVASILPANDRLRRYVDAQLLITAQSDADGTDLVYGATALDLAREGTFHFAAGISEIATTLARAARKAGADILYGTEVAAIITESGNALGVRLGDGARIRAEKIIAAIPSENTARLLSAGAAREATMQQATARHDVTMNAARSGYGAFTAYVGLPPSVVPDDLELHHQVLMTNSGALGEGNTTFLSFSAAGELQRARNGGRALTISTHTDVAQWNEAYIAGSYAAKRDALGAALLASLDRVVPGAAARADHREFATPHTFLRYTLRDRGLVGGDPQRPLQSNLFARGPKTRIRGLFRCGDTVFPGQSTVGVSLSAINALRECDFTVALPNTDNLQH